jgi:ComF family protein
MFVSPVWGFYSHRMAFLNDLVQSLLPTQCPLCSLVPDSPRSAGLCGPCESLVRGRLRMTTTPPSVVRCWTIGDYDGPHGALVRLAKYGRSIRVADYLGLCLGGALKEVVELMAVDAIVYVPVPPVRRMRRGFDQACRLANEVSASIGVPVLNAVKRIDGREQAGRTGSERRELGVHAFGLRAISLPDRILVVDDVLTTGATMNSVARVLRTAGVSHVFGAVIASP